MDFACFCGVQKFSFEREACQKSPRGVRGGGEDLSYGLPVGQSSPFYRKNLLSKTKFAR